MAFDLKKEEDVKQYLENLGIEYRFGCMSEKKPEVCHLLGDYMETVTKDFTKAATIYKSNCDDYSFSRSCHKFAGYTFMGKGVKEDQPKALDYFKKGCSLGEADSCLNAGLLCVAKSDRKKVPMDYPSGIGFLKEGCTKGNSFACYYLSGMYISGIENFLPKDMTEAHNYAIKACDLDDMYSCANLSRMYSLGEGCVKDEDKSKRYKMKAVELEMQHKSKYQQLKMEQGTT